MSSAFGSLFLSGCLKTSETERENEKGKTEWSILAFNRLNNVELGVQLRRDANAGVWWCHRTTHHSLARFLYALFISAWLAERRTPRIVYGSFSAVVSANCKLRANRNTASVTRDIVGLTLLLLSITASCYPQTQSKHWPHFPLPACQPNSSQEVGRKQKDISKETYCFAVTCFGYFGGRSVSMIRRLKRYKLVQKGRHHYAHSWKRWSFRL